MADNAQQPIEGTTTVDDKMTFEPERLSYVAARRVAAVIAVDIKDHINGKQIVIAGDTFLADIANLSAAKLQLDRLADDYHSVATSDAAFRKSDTQPTAKSMTGLIGAATTGGLQAVLGVTSLLRENVEFHGAATHIDPTAFHLLLAGALKNCCAGNIIVPDLIVVQEADSGNDSLNGKWAAVQTARGEAWRNAAPLLGELAQADAEFDAASRAGSTSINDLSIGLTQLRRAVEPLTETLSQAERRLTDLEARWSQADPNTGVTTLARLIRAEKLASQAELYLHAAVVSSGGHNRVSRNLFRMMFSGDGLSSLGGVVVRWALLSSDGSVVNGNVISSRVAAPFPGIFSDWGRLDATQ